MNARLFAMLFIALTMSCLPRAGGNATASDDIDVYTASVPIEGQPELVIEGSGATLAVFRDSLGQLQETAWQSSDGTLDVRVLFDPSTGAPTTIVDVVEQQFVLLNTIDETRVEFLVYDFDGRYQSGIAMFRDEGRLKAGTIAGRAAFEGQITGQLEGDNGETGSFAAVADPADTLTDVRELSEAELALIEVMQELESELSPGTPNAFSFRDGFLVGGAGMIAGGLYIAKTAAAGTALATGGPAIAVAGVLAVGAAIFVNELADGIEERFQSEAPVSQYFVGHLVENLRSSERSTILDNINDAANSAVDLLDYLRSGDSDSDDLEYTEPVIDAVQDVSDYVGSLQNPFDFSAAAAPVDGPENIAVDVEGQAVWQDGTTYDVEGTIDGDGNVDLQATSDDGETIDVDATLDENTDQVDGNFTGSKQGNVTGRVEDVGECSTTQEAGGTGTFSYAHSVGEGSGVVPFSYDAYQIPDAFVVSVGGDIVFDTGGLVSGFAQTDIPIDGEKMVFISVYAPEFDTQWEYQLGCLAE